MAVAFIVVGYAVLLLAFGWIGLVVILAHVGVMALGLWGAGRLGKGPDDSGNAPPPP
jgi:hypothetical protein